MFPSRYDIRRDKRPRMQRQKEEERLIGPSRTRQSPESQQFFCPPPILHHVSRRGVRVKQVLFDGGVGRGVIRDTACYELIIRTIITQGQNVSHMA